MSRRWGHPMAYRLTDTDRPSMRMGHADLRLLGGFAVEHGGEPLEVAIGGQRLLAFLAIHGPGGRALLAGTLWPTSSERRASASLRTTIWRLNRRDRSLIATAGGRLALAEGVHTDLHALRDHLHRLVAQPDQLTEDDLDTARLLGVELLPGWYEDWVLTERESLRQLQLHGLEALSNRLVRRRRYAEALEAALEAVRLDPLRESANRAVIAVHLAEDNVVEAVRHYTAFRSLLRVELQAEPSERLAAMFATRHVDLPPVRRGSPVRPATGGAKRPRPPVAVQRSRSR